ncbi:efflux RND transporter periplasmic adaptor subunit [Singulisphaera sp. PoT]|uniref:efflux RND transporter periplasmic adaptor subunit n=1 Tax=Singulisphaera sp. PoT TaxID=3411797 RepID=UPI003BF4B0CE
MVVVALVGRQQAALLAKSHKIQPDDPPPVSVRVVSLKEEVVESGAHYSAIVKELRKVELSFRVSGNLEYLRQVEGPGKKLRDVHEGDHFPQGTVLAKLDPADYRREQGVASERLAAATARQAQAEADMELAKVDHHRTEALVRRGSATNSELDSSRAKLRNTTAAAEAAKREVESARISLQQAEANLGYCTIKVPFPEGTVASRFVENYERVAANQRAFLLLDLSSVSIALGVPDTLVGRLAIGQTVDVTTDALPSERFAGVIHKIGSTADPQTRTYLVEIRIDKPRGLRPGMVASAHFRRETKAHLIPLTAVAPGTSERDYAVFRVEDDGKKQVVRRVPIEFDDVLDNRVVVRLDSGSRGLKPGEPIVATGVHRLSDGQAIHIIK